MLHINRLQRRRKRNLLEVVIWRLNSIAVQWEILGDEIRTCGLVNLWTGPVLTIGKLVSYNIVKWLPKSDKVGSSLFSAQKFGRKSAQTATNCIMHQNLLSKGNFCREYTLSGCFHLILKQLLNKIREYKVPIYII